MRRKVRNDSNEGKASKYCSAMTGERCRTQCARDGMKRKSTRAFGKCTRAHQAVHESASDKAHDKPCGKIPENEWHEQRTQKTHMHGVSPSLARLATWHTQNRPVSLPLERTRGLVHVLPRIRASQHVVHHLLLGHQLLGDLGGHIAHVGAGLAEEAQRVVDRVLHEQQVGAVGAEEHGGNVGRHKVATMTRNRVCDENVLANIACFSDMPSEDATGSLVLVCTAPRCCTYVSHVLLSLAVVPVVDDSRSHVQMRRK